jgi:GMP synthase-like glutamine amidotransferase
MHNDKQEVPMSKTIAIVNTHPEENPFFVENMQAFLAELEISPIIVEGYEENPLDYKPKHIFLTGVPLSATYSLSENETQAVVEEAFGWLLQCRQPVMGICYGHQILAHIFGGSISSLGRTILDERYPLTLAPDKQQGIFTGMGQLQVFAEHMDYISVVPEEFRVLCSKNDIPYIIYHPEKEFYGVQFVPELSNEMTKEALRRFVETNPSMR